jgi:sialidase-1
MVYRRSKNGGEIWLTAQFDSSLAEPVCQGALLSYPSDSNLLLFLNPHHPKQRKNLTLSISLDNGKTWRYQITIYSKLAAYSDLVRLPDNRLICIFEAGRLWPYAGIVHMNLHPINVQNSQNSPN